MRLGTISLLVLLIALGGCFYADPIEPMPPAPPPVPPVPPPVPPPPVPEPSERVPRSTFDAIHIGDPESWVGNLTTPERIVQVGAKTIYRWVLDEPRPEGGWLSWEVHCVDGEVVASFAW